MKPQIIWNGVEWEARFASGEIVNCPCKKTLEDFLRLVDSNGRRAVKRLQAIARRKRRMERKRCEKQT